MPPIIALLSCFLFILYLFFVDNKQRIRLDPGIWIPTVWFLIVASRPLSSWLNPAITSASADALLEGSPIDRAFYFGFILIGIIILWKRKISIVQLGKANPWIFLFFLYGVISVLWADYPIVAFKRWIKSAVGNSVMVLIILTDTNAIEAMKAVIRRCSYILIPLSIIFIKYFPELGKSYDPWTGEAFYGGVSYNKNGLGYLCMISGFFLFWGLLSLWKDKITPRMNNNIFIHVLLIIMIFWLFNVANSATSLASLMIGVGLLLFANSSRFSKQYRIIINYLPLILLISIPIVVLGFDILLSSIVDSTGHSDTFWGRVQLWEKLLEMGTNPLIGSGYESYWLGDRLIQLWEENWWQPNQAHNGYLETYLNLGWLGILLLSGILISTYRKSSKEIMAGFDYGKIRFAFLIIALLYNMTEAAFKGLHAVWFVFLLFSFDLPRPIAFSRELHKVIDA
jgi:O-antigen ligase